MNRFESLKKNRAVLFSVLVSMAGLIAMMTGGILSVFLVPYIGYDYYTLLLLQELFAIVFVLLIAKYSNTLYPLTRRGAGLVHSAQVAAYPFVLIAMVGVTMAMYGAQSGNPLQSPVQIAIYFLSMLSIGFVEELLFRGVVGDALIHHYGTSRAGIWKACAVGGLIFGLAHVSNLVGAAVLGVMIQTVVAAVLGMLFVAIYYRTGSLWICILLHASIDAACLLDSGLYGTGTISDAVSSYTLENLTPCLTYGLPVLFLLRARKIPEVQFWFASAAKPESDSRDMAANPDQGRF